MKKFIAFIVAIVVVTGLFSGNSFIGMQHVLAVGSSYYVSTSGSDTNSGSINSPFRTIQKGLNTASQPGDTVYVRTGTYNEKINFPYSGTSSGYITLQNYAGEYPVIGFAGQTNGGNQITINGKDYIKVIGFELKDYTSNIALDGYPWDNDTQCSGAVAVREDSDFVELRNLKIHDTNGGEAQAIAIKSFSSTAELSNITIDGCDIYNINPMPGEGIAFAGNVNGGTVSNTKVHDFKATSSTSAKIDFVGGNCSYIPIDRAPQNITVRNCEFYGVGASAYVDGGRYLTFEKNIFRNQGWGFSVAAEQEAGTNKLAEYIYVQNNLFYNISGVGAALGNVYYVDGNQSTNVRDIYLRNNTFYKCGDADSYLEGAYVLAGIANCYVTNNIAYVDPACGIVSGWCYQDQNESSIYMRNNTYYKVGGGTDNLAFYDNYSGNTYNSLSAYQTAGKEQNSNYRDPLLTNPASYDFALQSSSLEINSGSSTSGDYAPNDYIGTTRPQGSAPDRGAYEKLASQVTLFDETFNTQATGAQPTGWTIDAGTGTNVTVQAVPSSSDKSMRIYDNSTSVYTYSTKGFTATSGQVTFEYKVRCNGTASSYDGFTVGMKEGSTSVFEISVSSANYYYNGATSQNINSFTANTWNTIKIIANTNTDTCSVYFNDTLKLSNIGFSNLVSTLDSVYVTSFNGTSGTMYLDNMKVTNP